ncbi:MAG: MBL fold metallo-hydrolase [Acidithiobacillus sp.]|nr:MBL fold metallo-hydrolase [Acidithiobacillus sp.]
MIFRQFYWEKGRQLAYVVGDPITREAVTIDVGTGQLDPVVEFLRSRGLRLRFALQTHWNNDQREAALALRDRVGARILAQESINDAAVDMRIRHEDLLYFGEECLRVLHTPGLTPCAVMYQWEDRLFTGETLLAGGLHRRVPAAKRPALIAHLQNLLAPMADETLLYPAVENRGRRLGSLEELRRLGFGSGGPGLLARCTQYLQHDAAKKSPAAPAEEPLQRLHSGPVLL